MGHVKLVAPGERIKLGLLSLLLLLMLGFVCFTLLFSSFRSLSPIVHKCYNHIHQPYYKLKDAKYERAAGTATGIEVAQAGAYHPVYMCVAGTGCRRRVLALEYSARRIFD